MSHAPPRTGSLFTIGATVAPFVLSGYKLYRNEQDRRSLLNGNLSALLWNGPIDPVSWGAVLAGGSAFVDLFGGSAYKTLFDSVHGVLSAVHGSGSPPAPTPAVSHANAPLVEERKLTTSHRIYAAGIVSAILCWLHYEGASEMRARMHRVTRVANARGAVDDQRLRAYQRYSGEDADTFIAQEARDSVYKNHPYYVCDGARDGPHYLDFSVAGAWSLERTLRNLLLGLTLRTGVQGGHRFVPTILTVLEAGGLFELLCAMLRMRGFFALRAALIRIQHSLMAQTEPDRSLRSTTKKK